MKCNIFLAVKQKCFAVTRLELALRPMEIYCVTFGSECSEILSERFCSEFESFEWVEFEIEWNNDLIRALIECVHANEVVWNTRSPSFKNKNESAWLWIVEWRAGWPQSVKHKWRDMRNAYRRRLKLKTLKSGDAGRIEKNRWPKSTNPV